MFNLSEQPANISAMSDLPASNKSSSDRRYKVIDDHLYSNLKDEAVILNLANGKYYGLNSVGASIWRVLQEPITFAEIEKAVMAEFEVDEAICRREVSAFLDSMAKEGLIKISDD